MNGRVSNTNCCVVGCGNIYSNTNESMKFYSFPSRPYNQQQREQWIRSVRRQNNDGTSWQPKKFTRICSEHFIGNKKSDHPQNPSYVPTIFPKVYRKRQQESPTENNIQKKRRFDRALKRRAKNETNFIQPSKLNSVCDNSVHEQEAASTTKDFISQVNFGDVDEDAFMFDCTHVDSNNAIVQVSVGGKRPSRYRSFCDKKVGPDPPFTTEVKCKEFHGYNSINEDEQLLSISGITFDRFNLLLGFLHAAHGNEKVDVNNKLLLFLMKMKLGLTCSALAIFFGIHRTTAANIFLFILNRLVEKTKHFLFWPSKQAINLTMPKSFRYNYPKCRVIIDCTEIKIQQPKSVENRIYTYSHYKNSFTAKFLIEIAPNGFVTFLSKCYGGRASDAFITNDSGLLDLLEPEDLVLADKGFPGIKLENNIVLVMPPFVHDGRLSIEEVQETYNVASVRIHVERSIQRVKTHNILRNITHDLMPHLDSIVQMCCVFANLQAPILVQSP